MTTRRWMVAVAVVGLLLGVVIEGRRLKQRRDYYLQQANDVARRENYWRSEASRLASGPPLQQPPVTFIVVGKTHTVAEVAAEYAEVAAYNAKAERNVSSRSLPTLDFSPARQAGVPYSLIRCPSPTVFEKSDRPLPQSSESPSP